MNVLSVFDGISCGRKALENLKIPVDRYVSCEIDEYATSITKYNYPNSEQLGDVFNIDFTRFKGFDLLLGGSPCTYWSVSKSGREITCDGFGYKLFQQYVRALKELECKYFLYENVYSMHDNIKEVITKDLGVEPIMIDSALVSAQSRKRLYWTNIPNVTQPDNLGVVLKDVMLDDLDCYPLGCALRTYPRIRQGSEPRTKRLEIREDGKSNCLTSAKTDSMLLIPIRLGDIKTTAQAHRVYSVFGKSITLKANGGGQGGKTGLYKIDLPDGDYVVRNLNSVECERLQTLPDDYTKYGVNEKGKTLEISMTQRHKTLGNGWTVAVIEHILSGIKS